MAFKLKYADFIAEYLLFNLSAFKINSEPLGGAEVRIFIYLYYVMLILFT